MAAGFTDVTHLYDGTPEPAVRNLRFTVGPGWTGVVGANGCGKTTVLRLAAGELAPARGRVAAPAGAYCASCCWRARRFLERLANRWWRIAPAGGGGWRLVQ